MNKQFILIVDDEMDVLMSLSDLLENAGYETITAQNGEQAFRLMREKIPHLVILDLMLPSMDGYQICKKIRQNIVFQHIPVIILTAMDAMDVEMQVLDFGADDYMVKSIRPERLLAKIRSLIQRTYLGLDANPLTMLPGNNSIREKVNNLLATKDTFAFCYIDLDNFKVFNDNYGFEQGDKVIRLTANVLINIIKQSETINNFIGHIGGDDFVLITSAERVDTICLEIIKRFEASIPEMYSKEDRERGYIFGHDRGGIEKKFPLMTISIGIVTTESKNITHFAQISQIATEMKQYTKSFPGSNYFVNRRGIKPHIV
ncbi:response regulator [Candidatus Desantisbacteria bacterium]|nr:response regulator [Candidatus Desantisbacteria bacterium]